MLDTSDLKDLITHTDYALTGARIEVSRGQEYLQKDATKENIDYVKRWQTNVALLQDCLDSLNEIKI